MILIEYNSHTNRLFDAMLRLIFWKGFDEIMRYEIELSCADTRAIMQRILNQTVTKPRIIEHIRKHITLIKPINFAWILSLDVSAFWAMPGGFPASAVVNDGCWAISLLHRLSSKLVLAGSGRGSSKLARLTRLCGTPADVSTGGGMDEVTRLSPSLSGQLSGSCRVVRIARPPTSDLLWKAAEDDLLPSNSFSSLSFSPSSLAASSSSSIFCVTVLSREAQQI